MVHKFTNRYIFEYHPGFFGKYIYCLFPFMGKNLITIGDILKSSIPLSLKYQFVHEHCDLSYEENRELFCSVSRNTIDACSCKPNFRYVKVVCECEDYIHESGEINASAGHGYCLVYASNKRDSGLLDDSELMKLLSEVLVKFFDDKLNRDLWEFNQFYNTLHGDN